ncbi:hypothetical protein NIES4075_35180 [Tolypothrix sp. NIES-4075]|nr:hypothetical protein NIES4075_35180 [Tolypothrix sp. NIES-4075]
MTRYIVGAEALQYWVISIAATQTKPAYYAGFNFS